MWGGGAGKPHPYGAVDESKGGLRRIVRQRISVQSNSCDKSDGIMSVHAERRLAGGVTDKGSREAGAEPSITKQPGGVLAGDCRNRQGDCQCHSQQVLETAAIAPRKKAVFLVTPMEGLTAEFKACGHEQRACKAQ
jgi:hypothetical protein